MILGRTTYIDEIIMKAESQASIGPITVSIQSPNTLPQAVASPSVAYADIHYETKGFEKSLETSGGIHIEISEPKSPKEVIKTEVLRIPD